MQHFVAPTMKFICEAFGMQATRMMNRFKSCEENSDFFILGCWRKVYDLFIRNEEETKSEERNESTEADMKIRKMVCYLIIIRFYGLEKFNKRRE